ncbi:acyl-ACP--UDP-N-acetylglucosamine O-acyltransferase [Rhodopseudomonas pseudopalustris]|uniref:Acyl-[acyl-carrier-protein]--UDP-N-acetylglucosamine O-acyltransferase n=1 Tax=Rhodopseudomonas pseudopalustris TaxID=1513892 RepID=A0A1H8TA33_9BRAD|nr:acyl-ACP--UDP-N-acetylglucosamine O-acyltransferase [Rhodopseudomonas pseudopalustris]SEO87721.1 acyl-[acyl-carrier-protein]--UDP-N-acetylglucosamine O-acyltransferase [Rhodopseudomonas pseudopalustris]
MSSIDPTARIEDGAVIGDDVSIGPYCVIGSNVSIGAGSRLVGHVSVTGHTTIGDNCTIHPFASLGGAPQSTGYKGEPTKLLIGSACVIRENVTMNTGTVGGGGVTRVGDRGFFMAASHVGHDCIVGDDVIFANMATLGGHCEIGDYTFIGGMTVLQQFTRVGPQVMIGGMSGLRDDVIPYALASGIYARLSGLNIVGMRRRKFTRERLSVVRSFFSDLFYSPGLFVERLERVRPRASEDPAIAEIIAFIDDGQSRKRRRPLCMAADGARSSDDHDHDDA